MAEDYNLGSIGKMVGTKVFIRVNVGAEKPFIYRGILLGIDKEFIVVEDFKQGKVMFRTSDIVSMEEFKEERKGDGL
jgi:hypothetical protein